MLEAGDCVLQPPRIRHRVLECSPGMEVIEIGCPAESRDLRRPRARPSDLDPRNPERDFGGQRFVRHQAAAAKWAPFRLDGFECRDIGIAAATGGLAGVRVARPLSAPSSKRWRHDAEFLFSFVLEGSLTLESDGRDPRRLDAGSAFVLPAGMSVSLAGCSTDLELLEVVLPAKFNTIPG